MNIAEQSATINEIEQLFIKSPNLALSKANVYFSDVISKFDSKVVFELAVTLLKTNKLFSANHLCRLLVENNTNNPNLKHLLATINQRSGFNAVAVDLLVDCLELNPDLNNVRFDLVNALLNTGNKAAALTQAEILVSNEPSNPNYLGQHARCLVMLGEYSDALKIYQKLLELHPNRSQIYVRIGTAQRILGNSELAVEAFKNSIQENHMQCEAYWNLASMKTYDFTEPEKHAMLELDQLKSLSTRQRIFLGFALGEVFEKEENYSKSFDCYTKANSLSKQFNNYNSVKKSQDIQSNITTYSAEYFAKKPKGHESSEPIFILGMPRSGSTLVEQILSSHSSVDATMELNEISNMVSSMQAIQLDGRVGNYPAIVNNIQQEEVEKFGTEFLKRTASFRGNAIYFIDKTPSNFEHIGLIATILPNAKIIDVRRNPLACGFSIFKHFFATGFGFSSSLDDIGKYYQDYLKQMQHWNSVLPNKILTVEYEKLVTNFEPEVRKILDYCNLEFETGCLEFHKSKRAVATISSEQVRQKLYQSGVDGWKNYEEYLGPLKKALEA